MSRIEIHKATLDPETGWMVTPQEAYGQDEWNEHAKTCSMCGDEFVLYVSGDDDIDLTGRMIKYCSTACQEEAHRVQSREYARRKAAEKRAMALNGTR